MRILFMGTPEFAVPALSALVENQFEIIGVVTAPDKPSGRGMQIKTSPVKDFASSKNLPLFQPVKLRDAEFIETVRQLKPDLAVVVAFRMLPEVIWQIPKFGTINLHASLLPQYRGAAPINWAIIQGENTTGLTTFFIEKEIDTGKIIFTKTMTIPQDCDAGQLHDAMKIEGAALILKTVQAIQAGNYPQIEQTTTSILKSAPKLTKENCAIAWHQNALSIYNLIRGLAPYPAAWTYLGKSIFKVFKTELTTFPAAASPGTFTTDNKTFLRVNTNDYQLELIEIQMEGKKKMKVAEFLRGNNLPVETLRFTASPISDK